MCPSLLQVDAQTIERPDVRALQPADRAAIADFLGASENFTAEELDIALE